jgi:drug/metabolite transporter (DMT)-like permease
MDHASRLRGALFVAASALIWSTGGLIVRALGDTDKWTTVFWRSLWAFVFLAVFLIVKRGRNALTTVIAMGAPGFTVAACFTIASISLIVALQISSVANVLVIMSAAPMIAAILGWLFLSEHPNALTWIAVLASAAGIAIMVSESYSRGSIGGDAAAALIAIAYAVAIVTMRRHHDIEMLPAMCLAMLAALVISFSLANSLAVPTQGFLLLILFGAGQLGLGLALFSAGARHIPAAQTALIGNLEPILGPLWVWALMSERPSAVALIGGTIVIAAVMLHTSLNFKSAERVPLQ